jgi:hypothetical protein
MSSVQEKIESKSAAETTMSSVQEKIKNKSKEIKDLESTAETILESIASLLNEKTPLEREQHNIEEVITELSNKLIQINCARLMNTREISAENVALNERHADTLVRFGEQQTKIVQIRKKLLSNEIKHKKKLLKLILLTPRRNYFQKKSSTKKYVMKWRQIKYHKTN